MSHVDLCFVGVQMDRTSILGDTISYMKELLEKIHELQDELESGPDRFNIVQLLRDTKPNEMVVRNSPKVRKIARLWSETGRMIRYLSPYHRRILTKDKTELKVPFFSLFLVGNVSFMWRGGTRTQGWRFAARQGLGSCCRR